MYRWLLFFLLAGSTVLWWMHDPVPALPADESLRMNHIQVVGSHNSYKEAIDPSLLELMREESPLRAAALDYHHPSITRQLEHGLRSLEIDVVHDPEGGRYADPAGIQMVAEAEMEAGPAYDLEGKMAIPGFKALHIPDTDFRSNCLLFVDCLAEIRDWSDAHPDHVPIIITLNAKSDSTDRPGFVQPLPFTSSVFDALDAEVLSVLGRDRLITPDFVRGDYATLEEAVLTGGWPLLKDVRGKVMMVLDERGHKQAAYVEGHPGLTGRVFFVNAPTGRPEAAFLIMNSPVTDRKAIQARVQDGYMVRTRADANTIEARTGATLRREAAFASGAHVISTDYYLLEQDPGSGYLVSLPEGKPARCNPVLLPDPCRLWEE